MGQYHHLEIHLWAEERMFLNDQGAQKTVPTPKRSCRIFGLEAYGQEDNVEVVIDRIQSYTQ